MKSFASSPKLIDKATSGKNNSKKTYKINPWAKIELACIPRASKYKNYITLASKTKIGQKPPQASLRKEDCPIVLELCLSLAPQ
jgi:hypothetical protein